MSELGLGRNQLNTDELRAYLLIEDALKKHATTCDVSKVPRTVDIMELLLTVLGDNPDVIYFNKTKIRTMTSLFGKQVSFVGCMSKTQALQYEKQLKKSLEDAVWEIDKGAKDDKDILIRISEYLQRNVSYDKDELRAAMLGRSKHPEAHNAYGALVNHKAVCDGFASAYALIAQYFGMKCMVVDGKSSYNRNAKVEHAWNIIEYQGQYFHIDATWDTNTYETIKVYSYDYFGLDDDEISVDHEWNYRRTPKCNSDRLSYFIANGLYAYSEAQVEELLCKKMKQREDVIRIKISLGISLPGDGIKFLEGKMMSAASRVGLTCAFNYTWQENNRCLIVILDR